MFDILYSDVRIIFQSKKSLNEPTKPVENISSGTGTIPGRIGLSSSEQNKMDLLRKKYKKYKIVVVCSQG